HREQLSPLLGLIAVERGAGTFELDSSKAAFGPSPGNLPRYVRRHTVGAARAADNVAAEGTCSPPRAAPASRKNQRGGAMNAYQKYFSACLLALLGQAAFAQSSAPPL